MTDLLSEITFCDECPYSGEPNGCNRKEGVCKAHESYFDLVEENADLRERLKKAVGLPCKVGDKLYRFDGTKIIEYQVSMITLLSNGDCKIRVSYQLPAYNSRTIHEIHACDIGNKYFPTQAEACIGRGG